MKKKINELIKKLHIVTKTLDKDGLLIVSKELDRLIEEYYKEKQNEP